jgi:hypothetical protein
VPGSCQRITGDPFLNKCLLAYCLDGKNSIIAVKDGTGKLLARSIFRLLWDDLNECPVLFLDRLYPDSCLQEYKEAILSVALQQSQALGCPLLSSWGEAHIPYEGYAVSLKSSCPYEYADAGGGVRIEGAFRIEAPRVVSGEVV